MASYENLDILLQDIPGPSPQGKDIKYGPEYDQIKEASRADLDLPQGVWVQDLKSANWGEVEKICIDILQTKSKDLQIIAWLIEAWISLYNMKGIKQGFNLLLQCSEKYWDTAFPQLNPEDYDFRASPYNWINEKLSTRFNKIEVTAPEDPALLSYSYSTYIDTQKNGGISISSSPDTQTSPAQREGFEKSLRGTKTDFFKEFKADGEETLVLIKDLQTFLDTKMGDASPSLYHAQEKVEELVSFGDQILSTRNMPQEEVSTQLDASLGTTASVEPSPLSTDTPEPVGSSNVHVDMVMNSRSDAYDIINKAADYLEKLDPHSPSPHLIKRAIRWSNLDLKDLLQEMIKDPSSLEDLKHLLGMNQDNSNETNDIASNEPVNKG